MFKGFIRNRKKGSLSDILKDDIFIVKKPFVEKDPTVGQHIKDITIQDIQDWVNGFNNNIISGSITGDKNKTVTLTKRDGSIIQFSFADNEGVALDDVINTLDFDETNGVLTAITSEGIAITTNMDGRYSLLGHTHPEYDKYDKWGVQVNGGTVEYVSSDQILNLIAGSNTTISKNGKNITITSTATGGDNYGSWSVQVNGGTSTQISSGELLNFVGTGATTIARNGNTITINSTDTQGGAAIQGTLTRTASFSLDASMNQKTIICNLSSDITITIPSGLGTDFSCNIVSENSGVYYAELVQGAGTTLIAPHGKKLLTDYTCNVLKKTGQEVFNAQGELTL